MIEPTYSDKYCRKNLQIACGDASNSISPVPFVLKMGKSLAARHRPHQGICPGRRRDLARAASP